MLDDNEDWYDADEDDLEGNLDADTLPCPACGAELYADLDHCPQCGHWLSEADRRSHETGLFASRRVRIIAALLLAIFVLSLLAGTLAL